MEIANRLFKYRPINKWLESTLLESSLFLAGPAALNDPFEAKYELSFAETDEQLRAFYIKRWSDPSMRARLMGLVNTHGSDELKDITSRTPEEMAELIIQRQHFKDEAVQDKMRKYLENMVLKNSAVCCFSETGDSVLMFSHYADSHKGCCLEFGAQWGFVEAGKAARQRIIDVPDIRRVTYSDQVPVVNAHDPDPNSLIEATLFTKSTNWAYEREWRMWRYPGGPGPIRFDPRNLVSITFGCSASSGDINYVLSLLKRRAISVRLFQAAKGRDGYRLEVAPFDREDVATEDRKRWWKLW